MTIIVESSGENSFETDVLELVNDHWLEIGVKIFIHISQRDLLRRRVKGGDTIMTVGFGLDNGVPTADMSPRELAPTNDDQLQWPLWGLYALSNGTDGKAPTLPEAIALMDLMGAWRTAPSTGERERIWHEMLHIFTDQVFTIGIVNATLQPIVTAKRLQNVPHEALYGFDPTSFLGVYMPDTFWLSEGA
jgi:peptide/nickel transport system substrate-binding protein